MVDDDDNKMIVQKVKKKPYAMKKKIRCAHWIIRKELFELLFTLKINTVPKLLRRPRLHYIFIITRSGNSSTIIIQSAVGFFLVCFYSLHFTSLASIFWNVCCCLHFRMESDWKSDDNALLENLFLIFFYIFEIMSLLILMWMLHENHEKSTSTQKLTQMIKKMSWDCGN